MPNYGSEEQGETPNFGGVEKGGIPDFGGAEKDEMPNYSDDELSRPTAKADGLDGAPSCESTSRAAFAWSKSASAIR